MYHKYNVKSEQADNLSANPTVEEFSGIAQSMNDLVKAYVKENELNAYALDFQRKRAYTNYQIYTDDKEVFLHIKEVKN